MQLLKEGMGVDYDIDMISTGEGSSGSKAELDNWLNVFTADSIMQGDVRSLPDIFELRGSNFYDDNLVFTGSDSSQTC